MPRNWLDLLNIPAQWPYTKGKGVKVAVLDYCAGSKYAIPVNYDPARVHWHGQGCAYIVKQIAPEAEVYGINVIDKEPWRVARALQWCIENGIHLVNMSISYGPTEEDRQALDAAVRAGVVLVAAAGNNEGKGVTWPGDDPNTITVAPYMPNTGQMDNMTSRGQEVDIAAPTGAYVPTGMGNWIPLPNTSGATPHITGSLALFWQRFQEVNARPPTLAECRGFLIQNAKDLMGPGKDNTSGYGLFKFPIPESWPEKKEDDPLVASLLNYDLRTKSMIAPEALDKFVGGTPLDGTGAAFVQAEDKYSVNARYLLAHAILESGWGKSQIAQLKNNIFGFTAYDSSPGSSATNFRSFATCIDYVAGYISREYLTPGGEHYNGPTLAGMNMKYATDLEWGKKIASIMAQVPTEPLRGEPPQPVAPEPAPEATDPPNDYAGRWSEGVIEKAKKYDLMQGDPDGKFRPADPLTREEAADLAVSIYERISEKVEEA